MTLPLLIKFPSRSRPRLFRETFAKWNAVPADVTFMVSLDHGDETLPEYLEFLHDKSNVLVFVGRSSCKVEAINRDMEQAPDWSAVAIAADDMIPQRTDYAVEIMRLMAAKFPDTDGVLHLNDGRVGERCNTMPVIGRKFYDRFGYVFHPAFKAVYCDEELTEVAQGLGRSFYVAECLIHHAWPAAGEFDALSRRNEDRTLYDADCVTFQKRKAAGYPI